MDEERCAFLSLSDCSFKTLNDRNSTHLTLFHSGTRWLSFQLDSIAALVTLFVTLFVVLSDNAVISPSLKGLALSYTSQVRHSLLCTDTCAAAQLSVCVAVVSS